MKRRVQPSRHRSPVTDLLRLQQTAGNQAVGTLLRQVAPPKPKTDEEIWAEDWADATSAAARKHFAGCVEHGRCLGGGTC